LKSENAVLREQLKKMSENVNILIDKMNQESLKKKKFQPDNSRPGSQRIRTKEEEIKNTDKAIQNLVREHQRLRRRLEEVQSPDFLINLKKKLKETDQEIKEHERLKNSLHVEQIRREKRLDKIIEKNEPENMKTINDQTARLAYLSEKVSDLKEQLEKAERLKDQQIEHIEELKQRQHKLNQIAQHYGVDHEKNMGEEAERLQQELELLEKQKRILKSAIDTMNKKYESTLAAKKKEFDQLYYKKASILKSYNEKIKALRGKGQEIRDLIEKVKVEADKGILDMLVQWEETNNKIFEKYPNENESDYSILEAAVSEVHKLEASHTTIGGQGDTEREGVSEKKGKAKKEEGKKEEEKEMKRYMEELKKKDEEL